MLAQPLGFSPYACCAVSADRVWCGCVTSIDTDHNLRRVVRLVAVLNLAYFGLEFAVARVIGSVSLFADSIDFLEDASVNFLILAALDWTARRRARVGMALAGILLVPGLSTLWTAWEKFHLPVAPDPALLSLTGAGALAVNLSCAFMLARYRRHGGSLTRAAFLSARNDAVANVAIIAAGLLTAFLLSSGWPDLIAGLGIAAMNADAAREVWQAAREEHRTAEAQPWFTRLVSR
jgi:Co/Zn/Cd efflux system component